ncbi:MAG: DNRLRE domain-containing protein [Chitinophagaceae bacterium]|nr:DNRLRE domain-containing protein [Chitinophagaceae bacterium]
MLKSHLFRILTPPTPDERRSLLRFDLSSIPVGSTIQSAELQFYVNTEGQGFNMHRMLVPWDEATVTYTS